MSTRILLASALFSLSSLALAPPLPGGLRPGEEGVFQNWVCEAQAGLFSRHECRAYGFDRLEAEQNFYSKCGWYRGTDPWCHQVRGIPY